MEDRAEFNPKKITALFLFCLILIIIDVLFPAHARIDAKQQLINHMLPAIHRANDAIWNQRIQIRDLQRKSLQNKPLSKKEIYWLTTLAKTYKIKSIHFDQKATWQALLHRVDVIPASLALAQAGHESAWGTSRFAEQGNNYFGEWCFRRGCGMVPRDRPTGRTYEARSFPSMYAAITAYMRNLNTNTAYRALWNIRYALRLKHQALSGYQLAPGIAKYNPSRGQYVKMIQSLIRHFKLAQYDKNRKMP